MGIKGLTKLLAEHAPKSMKEQKFESYFGRTIAIDASMCIYQFLIVVGRNGTEMLTNEAGEVTSHLQGMFYRTIRLLEAGLKPVYVFDGKAPDLKKEELAKRGRTLVRCQVLSSQSDRSRVRVLVSSPNWGYSKRVAATEDLVTAIEEKSGDREVIEKFSKRTVMVNKKHNEDCKRLLRLMGVPVIEAPSEAEAECAALCKNGKVYAVSSEDMDTLTFGAPRLLRYLMAPSSRKVSVMEIELAKILGELNLNMDQFIDLCILCGCDYCDSIRGIGGQRGLKLIRQYGSIENILENINKERYQMPDNWRYQEARDLFKEPLVSATGGQLEIKWTAPDEAGLLTFLVNENAFNNDRVRKAIEKIKAADKKASFWQAIEMIKATKNKAANKKASFWQAIEMIKATKNKASQGRLYSFKPAMSVSAPIRWKDSICMLGAPRPAVKSKMFSLQVCFHSKVIGSLNLPIPQLSFEHLGTICKGVCLGT